MRQTLPLKIDLSCIILHHFLTHFLCFTNVQHSTLSVVHLNQRRDSSKENEKHKKVRRIPNLLNDPFVLYILSLRGRKSPSLAYLPPIHTAFLALPSFCLSRETGRRERMGPKTCGGGGKLGRWGGRCNPAEASPASPSPRLIFL